MWSHYRVLRSLHCSQTEKYCIQNDFWNFVLSLTENEGTRHLISCRLISREKLCTEKSISHGEIRWGKISVSTKDSCPNQINSKVKWSALNHIFALVENASNRQKKDLERVQKQRARVWGSHPSGKNFTPALRFTRLVILYPDLLSTKITRLAKGGIFRKKHTTVQELIAHLYILFPFTWLLGPIESDVTLNCWDSHEVPSG